MQVTTELSGLFSYSFTFVVVVGLIFITLLIGTYLFYRRRKEVAGDVIYQAKDPGVIKEKYLKELEALELKINNNEISLRKSYQRLSYLIRGFTFEITGIKASYYCLSELEVINIPKLSELIKEFYDPEFALESKGDIIKALNKTKMVILEWN